MSKSLGSKLVRYGKTIRKEFYLYGLFVAFSYILFEFGVVDNKFLERAVNKSKFKAKGKRLERIVTNLYEENTGRRLDLNHLEDFDSKIQWLKIYDCTSIKTTLADKFQVREWVDKIIGEKYLIPLLGVYDRFDDINFDALPDRFVIKSNHGSGQIKIIKNKSDINTSALKEIVDMWLEKPYGLNSMERHYFNIPRKIVIEEYIEEINKTIFDYKIHCFNGVPRYIQVIGDRDLDSHIAKERIYDITWKRTEYHTVFEDLGYDLEKPALLDEMIDVAEKLSAGFKYVRVDLYVLDSGIKFGEMTFAPSAGYGRWEPKEGNKVFGALLDIDS